jgi:hypothetical protein
MGLEADGLAETIWFTNLLSDVSLSPFNAELQPHFGCYRDWLQRLVTTTGNNVLLEVLPRRQCKIIIVSALN